MGARDWRASQPACQCPLSPLLPPSVLTHTNPHTHLGVEEDAASGAAASLARGRVPPAVGVAQQRHAACVRAASAAGYAPQGDGGEASAWGEVQRAAGAQRGGACTPSFPPPIPPMHTHLMATHAGTVPSYMTTCTGTGEASMVIGGTPAPSCPLVLSPQHQALGGEGEGVGRGRRECGVLASAGGEGGRRRGLGQAGRDGGRRGWGGHNGGGGGEGAHLPSDFSAQVWLPPALAATHEALEGLVTSPGEALSSPMPAPVPSCPSLLEPKQ